jgi:hypothetical protein
MAGVGWALYYKITLAGGWCILCSVLTVCWWHDWQHFLQSLSHQCNHDDRKNAILQWVYFYDSERR